MSKEPDKCFQKIIDKRFSKNNMLRSKYLRIKQEYLDNSRKIYYKRFFQISTDLQKIFQRKIKTLSKNIHTFAKHLQKIDNRFAKD